MPVKVTVNFGFLKLESNVDFTNKQRENWTQLLSELIDYRLLSSLACAEYVPEVMNAVVRLRNDVLPSYVKDLDTNDPLRKSYEEMRRAIRDFLTAVRGIDSSILTNKITDLSKIKPVGSQWIFVSALQRLRDVFVKEVTENCAIFGLELPEEFQSCYRLPEPIAEEWADEVAALFDVPRP